MGVQQKCNEMMKLVLIFAVIAIATALPAETEDPYAEAKGAIAELLQQGKSDAGCRSLATSTIDEVNNGVKTVDDLYKNFDKGHACAGKGSEQVAVAKRTKKKADHAVKTATAAVETKCSASVTWKFNLNTVSPKSCSNVFFGDAGYLAAKAACDHAKEVLGTAHGAAKEAAAGVISAEAAAARARSACFCKVQKEHKMLRHRSEAANSVGNSKAWVKAHHMLCVLDNKAPTACKVPPAPKVKIPAVAAGVESENCADQCPHGFSQIGTASRDNDVGGSCLGQYCDQDSSKTRAHGHLCLPGKSNCRAESWHSCAARCKARNDCHSFMYSPKSQHGHCVGLCELCNKKKPNNSWGNGLYFCAK